MCVKFTSTTMLFLQLVTHLGLCNCYKAISGHWDMRLTRAGWRTDFVQVIVSVF